MLSSNILLNLAIGYQALASPIVMCFNVVFKCMRANTFGILLIRCNVLEDQLFGVPRPICFLSITSMILLHVQELSSYICVWASKHVEVNCRLYYGDVVNLRFVWNMATKKANLLSFRDIILGMRVPKQPSVLSLGNNNHQHQLVQLSGSVKTINVCWFIYIVGAKVSA